MVVCKFWQRGNCRFGNDCRNEHPGAGNSGGAGNAGGFGGGNRFGALANSGGSGNGKNAASMSPTAVDVRTDLTEGKGMPNWILTAYGPGKNPAASLLEANEFSPEEVRVRFYEAASNGKQDEADREAISLWNRAQQAINDVKNGADNVGRFLEEASKKEPNRISLCKMDGTRPREQFTGAQSTAFPFGSTQTPSNPFSQPPKSTFAGPSGPSAFGGNNTQPQSSLGRPAFGSSGFSANTTQQTPTFGQGAFGGANTASTTTPQAPSFGHGAFGGTSSTPNAFGAAPSAANQQGPTFGQGAFAGASSTPSAFGSGPTFGQGSTLGKPSLGSTGFSQPAFGSTGFGSQGQSNAFAAPSAASTAAPQPSPFGQQPTFGQGVFSGNSNQQPSTSTAFSQPPQPSAFGAGTTGPGIFGKPTDPGSAGTSGFGTQQNQPPPKPSSGTDRIFDNKSYTPASDNPFSIKAPANPIPHVVNVGSPLSKEADMGNAPSRPTTSSDTPFSKAPGQAAQPQASSSSTTPPVAKQRPEVANPRKVVPLTYTQSLPNVPPTYDQQGKLLTYCGQRVIYEKEPTTYINGAPQPPKYYPCYRRPDGKGNEKIWFPMGNDDPQVKGLENKVKEFENPEEDYTEEVVKAYEQLHLTGRFPGGVLPRAAPRREFVDCDF